MIQASYHFPRGFLWGTATSSHQVEGNNTNNDWSAWEQEPGRIIHDHQSGLACDWWGGRWKEDFDRASDSNQNAHRLSIEWSRIQPTPDRWDEDAIDHYREIVRGLRERGMKPLITLHHFTNPLWFAELGGWESQDAPGLFARYVEKIVDALQEYASIWITINEPNVLMVYAYLMGYFPPGKRDLSTTFRIAPNLVRAHAAAYHAIHRIQPQAWVGIAQNYRGFIPARSWFPLDNLVSRIHSRLFNDLFPEALSRGVFRNPIFKVRTPEARGAQDFLGINYYSVDRVAFSLFHPKEMFGRRFYPEDADLSDTGFLANEPEGMYEAIQWGRRFKLPIIVTENGVEDADDHMRPRFIVQHLHQVWRAVNFNSPVKGYFHWSLVDNFEWERGWTQRFGLWELDPGTQTRRKRLSADLYAEICRENGITTEMVSRYAPEAFAEVFPTNGSLHHQE